MKPVIYIYNEIEKEKIITLLFTLMFSGINILVKNWKDIYKYDCRWKVMLDKMKSYFKLLQLIIKLLMQSAILSPFFQIFTNIYILYVYNYLQLKCALIHKKI